MKKELLFILAFLVVIFFVHAQEVRDTMQGTSDISKTMETENTTEKWNDVVDTQESEEIIEEENYTSNVELVEEDKKMSDVSATGEESKEMDNVSATGEEGKEMGDVSAIVEKEGEEMGDVAGIQESEDMAEKESYTSDVKLVEEDKEMGDVLAIVEEEIDTTKKRENIFSEVFSEQKINISKQEPVEKETTAQTIAKETPIDTEIKKIPKQADNYIKVELSEQQINITENKLKQIEKKIKISEEKVNLTAKNVIIKKESRLYEYIDPLTNLKRNNSIIVIKIEPKKTLFGFKLIEEIPKSIAKDVSEIIFYEGDYDYYRIIEPDPLIVWHFTKLDSNTEVSYGVNKEVKEEQLEEGFTLPLAEEVEGTDLQMYSPLNWFNWGIFIIGIVVFTILVTSYAYRYESKKVDDRELIKRIKVYVNYLSARGYDKAATRNFLLSSYPADKIDKAMRLSFK